MRLPYGFIKQAALLVLLLLKPALHLNSETLNSNDSVSISNNIHKINQNIDQIHSVIKKENDTLKQAILNNIELSISEQYMHGLAWNYFLMGRYYQLRFNNDSARMYYEKAWPLVSGQDIAALTHSVSLGLGNIYWESGNYSAGIEFTLEAKRYFDKQGTMNTKYGLMNLIALNYEGLFEYEKALNYFREALSIADSMQQEAFVGIIYSNIGRLFFKNNEYLKALNFLHKGVKIEEAMQYISNAGKSYTIIADAYLELGKTDSSLKYLNKALSYNLKSNDDLGLTRIYLSFGRYYHELEQYKKSVEYLLKSVDLAKKIHLNNELITSYKLLAQNYKELGQHKTSNHYYILYFELYQEIYDVEKINKINALEHQLRLQNKENEIASLKLNEEINTKHIFLITTIAALLISLLLIFFIVYFRKSNKILKVKNEEIIEQKNILEQLNEELILAEQNAGKADEIKNKFLNNLTHEIRTPLNGIVGFSSLIAESKLSDEKKKKTWKIIRQNSETLINTVEGLLKLSMLASNQISTRKTKVNVHEFLTLLSENVLLRNDHILRNKINFKYIPEISSKEIEIHTDPDLLSQIILNILDNAFKFTPKGTVSLRYKILEKQLRIFISDTGIGIKEAHENDIFTQFTKGSNIAKNSAGLGIGLTISKKLAELMDGSVSYYSELNKGSTFYVSLPR